MSVRNVTVIGSGLMGAGIAQVVATSGREVRLVDMTEEILEKATQKIRSSLDRLSEKKKLRESPESILHRIRTSTNLPQGVNDADFVIEAVPEDINLKRNIFRQIDASAPKHTFLATNTTSLPITVIAEATSRKHRVIGMHWMNPPQLMKLVEVIRGKFTDEETLRTTLDLCASCGKETVTANRDVWFFLVLRARVGLSLEAYLMYLRKEADFKEIDAAIRYKIGLPMGEFELSDFVGGVDIRTKGIRSIEEVLKTYPYFEPWPVFLSVHQYLLKEIWGPMNEKGLSGVKTGKGFYDYPEKKYVKPPLTEEMAQKVEPIQLVAPAVNTAAWCVTNGVGEVGDIDRAFKLAFGWPKGVFEFMNEYGVKNVVGALRAKQTLAPEWLKDFYDPDPFLTRMG